MREPEFCGGLGQWSSLFRELYQTCDQDDIKYINVLFSLCLNHPKICSYLFNTIAPSLVGLMLQQYLQEWLSTYSNEVTAHCAQRCAYSRIRERVANANKHLVALLGGPRDFSSVALLGAPRERSFL